MDSYFGSKYTLVLIHQELLTMMPPPMEKRKYCKYAKEEVKHNYLYLRTIMYNVLV